MPPIKKESSLDFSKMIFNVSQVPENVDLVDKFKRLQLYDEFTSYKGTPAGLPHRDNTIRFVFYFYDKGCPFQDLKTYKERLDKCLDWAGFKKTKGEWPESIQSMVDGDIEEVNKMIRCFLFKIQDCRKFNAYVSIDKAYQDTIENISSPIKEDDISKREKAFELRHKNIENLIKIMDKIDSLEKELFNDKEEIKELSKGTDLRKSDFNEGHAEKMVRFFSGSQKPVV
jgi:hypothetical protein